MDVEVPMQAQTELHGSAVIQIRPLKNRQR